MPLLGIGKILVVDFWTVTTTDKVATLIVMGAALILVSFLYSHYRETILKRVGGGVLRTRRRSLATLPPQNASDGLLANFQDAKSFGKLRTGFKSVPLSKTGYFNKFLA